MAAAGSVPRLLNQPRQLPQIQDLSPRHHTFMNIEITLFNWSYARTLIYVSGILAMNAHASARLFPPPSQRTHRGYAGGLSPLSALAIRGPARGIPSPFQSARITSSNLRAIGRGARRGSYRGSTKFTLFRTSSALPKRPQTTPLPRLGFASRETPSRVIWSLLGI